MTEGELPKRVESAAIQRVLTQIRQVAPTPSTVLLLGETGTGKEVMARAIHDLSPRRQRRMIGGAARRFHGPRRERAVRPRKGRVHGCAFAADRAVRSRPPVHAVPRRDRRLADGRPGQAAPRTSGARDRTPWERAARQGRRPHHRGHEPQPRGRGQRQDLSRGSVYRLNVFPVVVPPLRERVEDIPALAWTFVDEFAHRSARRSSRFQRRACATCSATPGRETSASCATSSNARSSWQPALSWWWRLRGSMIGGCPGTR